LVLLQAGRGSGQSRIAGEKGAQMLVEQWRNDWICPRRICGYHPLAKVACVQRFCPLRHAVPQVQIEIRRNTPFNDQGPATGRSVRERSTPRARPSL